MPACPHDLPFDEGERFGVIAAPPMSGLSRGFAMVVGGVWIASLDLPELGKIPAGAGAYREPTPLTGIIADDRLRKTADHSDIVREQRFAEMLRAVQPHATRLIRGITDRKYSPPKLPEIVGGVTVVVPLPDIIDQLAPRPGLVVSSLESFPEGQAVFRVRPEDAETLAPVADPARFPHPVLVLSDAQVPSLEDAAPHLAVHRLSSPADVDFVRRMMERRQRVREARIPFRDARKEFLHGTLHLRHYAGDPSPCVADRDAGDVPVTTSVAGVTVRCEPSQLGLPGVTAHLELDLGVELMPDEVIPSLDEAVTGAAWKLLPLGSSSLSTPERELAIALLATHARPHFVDAEGTTELEVSISGLAHGEVAQLRGLPLADTVDGPLSFDGLLGLVGTDEVVELRDPDDLARLLPLEECLGVGHLTTRELMDSSVLAVGRRKGPWSPQLGGHRDSGRVRQLLWIGFALRTGLDDAGWQEVDLGIPGVGAAVRTDLAGDPGDWRSGQEELFRQLSRVLRDQVALVTAGVDMWHPRVRGMCRLTALRLAERLEMLESERLLLAPDGTSRRRLSELRAKPGFSVWPRHGPAVSDPEVLLVDLDELRVLDRAGRLPLRFDDPPELWESLADPSAPGWLARTELAIPGLRGWLGLRLPFDDTTGVFLQSAGLRVALPEVDADLPCHGLLRTLGGYTELSSTQRRLLGLARTQLYGEVEAAAGGAGADPAVREAAALYLERWEDARTPQPEPSRVRLDRDGHLGGDVTAEMQRRLVEASSFALGDQLLHVLVADADQDDPPLALNTHFKMASIEVNRNHPLGRQALAGPGRARELLLLEMARMASDWGQERDRGFDLLEAQRILIAQRLGES